MDRNRTAGWWSRIWRAFGGTRLPCPFHCSTRRGRAAHEAQRNLVMGWKVEQIRRSDNPTITLRLLSPVISVPRRTETRITHASHTTAHHRTPPHTTAYHRTPPRTTAYHHGPHELCNGSVRGGPGRVPTFNDHLCQVLRMPCLSVSKLVCLQ